MPSFPTFLLPLHAGEPDPTGFLFSAWTPQPGVLLGPFALVAAYVLLAGPLNRRSPGWEGRTVSARQKAAFYGGVATLLVALGPPLDDWSGHYLLTAHMVQHLLLMLLAPPLLLAGVPGWMLAPLARNPVANRIGYVLTRPVVAYGLASATLIAWHLPALYEAALYSDLLHLTEHALFFATALLAWWPVLGSLPQWPRISPMLQCLYYSALTIPGAIVGAFIVFSEPGLYRPYDTAPRVFGIDLATDQDAAGLLMWVGEGTIYLLLITVTFLRWAGEQERADRARPGTAARLPRSTEAPATERA
jgi:putative membrane protein